MPIFKKQHLNLVKKPKYMPKGFIDEDEAPELGALEIIENPEKSQTSSQYAFCVQLTFLPSGQVTNGRAHFKGPRALHFNLSLR